MSALSPKLCRRCAVAPRTGHHPSARYCDACRAHLRAHPALARVTPRQAQRLRALLGTMPRAALATLVGLPLSRLNHYIQRHGLRSNRRWVRPEARPEARPEVHTDGT